MTDFDDDMTSIETDKQLEEALAMALEGYCDIEGIEQPDIATFADAGILSGNRRLVVRIRGGCEYQVTIVNAGPWR